MRPRSGAWPRRRRSTCADLAPPVGRDLGARAHAVLGLEVDEDVGPTQSPGDLILQLGGGGVGVLERGAGAELDVEVDVAARARPPRAQPVEAGDAPRAE